MLLKPAFLFLALLITSPVLSQPNTPTVIQELSVSGHDVAWSSNSLLLAVTDENEGIHLYESSSFTSPRQTLLVESPASAVAFNPVSNFLAYGTTDGTIYLIDIAAETQEVLGSHQDAINDIVFSSDGLLLASSSEDNTTRLWNMETGAQRVLSGHTDATWSAAFYETGNLLLTSAADEDLRLWDVNSGNLIATLAGHTDFFDEVRSVVLQPNTSVFVSGSTDDTIRLWDANQNGANVGVSETGSSGVTSLAFHPNGNLLAVGTENDEVQLWDFDSREITNVLPGPRGDITSVAFSPDGQYLAIASDNGAQVWGTFELATGFIAPLTPTATSMAAPAQNTQMPTESINSTTAPASESETQQLNSIVMGSVNTGGSVNVRSCPSTDCAIVGSVGPSDSFAILLVENDWYFVRLSNDQLGYVFAQLVRLPEGANVNNLPTLTPSPSPSPTPLPPTPTPDLSLTATFTALGELVEPKEDGFYLVGSDIQTGRWESTGTGVGCYWERLDVNGDIIDNHFGEAGGAVTVQASDYEIHFEDCGTWQYVENQPRILRDDAFERKGDGFYTVGIEIAPGQWRSTGEGNNCYWERSNRTQDIINNHFGIAGGTIHVSPSDDELYVSGCGDIEYIGS